MEERLKAGFTLILGLTGDERIRGGYLKSTDRGIVPCGLCGEEILFVSNYPNILEEITGNNILQVYKSPDGYVSMVGLPKTEGPYCEDNYLEVISSSINEALIDGLEELNRKLSFKEEISHQKVYKLYGEDKYKMKEVCNEK